MWGEGGGGGGGVGGVVGITRTTCVNVVREESVCMSKITKKGRQEMKFVRKRACWRRVSALRMEAIYTTRK